MQNSTILYNVESEVRKQRQQSKATKEETREVKGFFLGSLRRFRGAVLRIALFVDLLEEAKRRLLGFVDPLLDLLSVDRSVTVLALGSDLTELSDEFGDLVLLGSIELVLEFVHG
jgi:hypothetical protein